MNQTTRESPVKNSEAIGEQVFDLQESRGQVLVFLRFGMPDLLAS
jgi:hypothetical protein